MKKILLLGGSAQQIIAIETAKRLGYYTILCDFLPDNPGQFKADIFYPVSTTDKEAVLAVAQRQQVDGVLAYASDPAAPTAAYVAEQMGLPTNPYQSVNILCNKALFRSFLRENGFNTPVTYGYRDSEAALSDTGRFQLPVIVKPVDSSGSKGITVIYSWSELEDAITHAFAFSRSHHIIIEEFIDKKHPYLIGGDIFVVDGQVVLWGLLNCHRDSTVNPLVPVGKSYPLVLDKPNLKAVKETLQCMVDKLGLKFGAINVEAVVDRHDRVWLIDIGPRAGGNMIPDLLGMIFQVDVTEMAISAAMGMPVNARIKAGIPFYATHNLHTDKNGIFESIQFSEGLRNCIVRVCIYKKWGDRVEYFDNAAKALGIVFLKFKSDEEMYKVLKNINEYISVKVREDE